MPSEEVAQLGPVDRVSMKPVLVGDRCAMNVDGGGTATVVDNVLEVGAERLDARRQGAEPPLLAPGPEAVVGAPVAIPGERLLGRYFEVAAGSSGQLLE